MSVLDTLTAILIDAEYQVQTAASSEDALAILNGLEDNQLPQLIITDLNMPGMTGLQFVKTVRACAKYSRIPCLIISASLIPAMEQELTQLAHVTALRKPFAVEVFCEIVNALWQND